MTRPHGNYDGDVTEWIIRAITTRLVDGDCSNLGAVVDREAGMGCVRAPEPCVSEVRWQIGAIGPRPCGAAAAGVRIAPAAPMACNRQVFAASLRNVDRRTAAVAAHSLASTVVPHLDSSLRSARHIAARRKDRGRQNHERRQQRHEQCAAKDRLSSKSVYPRHQTPSTRNGQ
ncbi:MAG TPA: hypothetical protein VGO29_09075 [Solirubrobacteraceae bacterium]|nr:hypothetical protein [Solirubrobacteraceae bacterium]